MNDIDDLSLLPDPWNRWAYAYSNRDLYCSPEAVALREARDRAIRSAPQWMSEIALLNDDRRRAEKGRA